MTTSHIGLTLDVTADEVNALVQAMVRAGEIERRGPSLYSRADASRSRGKGATSHDVAGGSEELASASTAAAASPLETVDETFLKRPPDLAPDWHTLGYPAGAPSREDVLATLERRARERQTAGGRGAWPVGRDKLVSR